MDLKRGLEIIHIGWFVFFFNDFSCVRFSGLEELKEFTEGNIFPVSDAVGEFPGFGFLRRAEKLRGRVHRKISPE